MTMNKTNHPVPQGILFDLGDTLLHQAKHDLTAGLNRLIELSDGVQKRDADAFREAGKSLFHVLFTWRFDIPDCGLMHIELRFQSFLRLLLERFGLNPSVNLDDLELEFWRTASPMLPEPGVHAVFERLKTRGIPAGVVSNTAFSSEATERKLARHGLAGHLSFVMASSDYGIRKPHPDLFLTAVRKLGLEPGEVWFVGNSLECDVVGAQEVGLLPVWYTRRVTHTGDYAGLQVRDWDAFLMLLQ